MKILDRMTAWLFVAFGATHAVLGMMHAITTDMLWFISGGLLIIAVAAMNLLRSHYGDVVRALNWTSLLFNLMTLALFLAIALHMEIPLIKAPQVLVGVLLVAVLVHFSTKQTFAPRASGRS